MPPQIFEALSGASFFDLYLDACQNINMHNEGESIYKALADGQRRQILRLLRQQERPAGDIAEAVGLTPATVSHHLARLKDAELVRVRKQGQQRIYALNTSVVEEALLLLTDLIKPKERDEAT